MKNKVLIICGPTATGKTSLALHLAEVFDGELVSADSRQVYKGMDIGTGKDVPKNFEFRISNIEVNGVALGYYKGSGTRIWGYDLVAPKEEFSVAHYLEFARPVLDNIEKRNKLPIVVGGTGLYISALEGTVETAHIPPNKELREKHKDTSAEELYSLVVRINPELATSLNNSDKNNPRRLLRLLEIEQSVTTPASATSEYDGLKIGLTCSQRELEIRIKERVKRRLVSGFEDEVNSLLSSGVEWTDQSMTSLGYRQWQEYGNGSMTKEEVIEEWIKEEKRYAKRQITWFKRDEAIQWFDVEDDTYQEKVEGLVTSWHNTEREE